MTDEIWTTTEMQSADYSFSTKSESSYITYNGVGVTPKIDGYDDDFELIGKFLCFLGVCAFYYVAPAFALYFLCLTIGIFYKVLCGPFGGEEDLEGGLAKTGCSINEGDGDKGLCDKSDEQDRKGRSENCRDDNSVSKDQNSDISHAEVDKVLNTCESDKDGMSNNLKINNNDGRKDENDEKSDSKDESENYEDGVSANQVENADTSNGRVLSKVNACTTEEKDNMIKDSINNVNGSENENEDDDEKDDDGFYILSWTVASCIWGLITVKFTLASLVAKYLGNDLVYFICYSLAYSLSLPFWSLLDVVRLYGLAGSVSFACYQVLFILLVYILYNESIFIGFLESFAMVTLFVVVVKVFRHFIQKCNNVKK